MKLGATAALPAGSKRRTGARTRRQRRAAAGPPAVAGVLRRIPTYPLLSEDGLDTIDRATDRILQEIGIEFRGDADALALWRKAGADVQAGRRDRVCECAVDAKYPSGEYRGTRGSLPRMSGGLGETA